MSKLSKAIMVGTGLALGTAMMVQVAVAEGTPYGDLAVGILCFIAAVYFYQD